MPCLKQCKFPSVNGHGFLEHRRYYAASNARYIGSHFSLISIRMARTRRRHDASGARLIGTLLSLERPKGVGGEVDTTIQDDTCDRARKPGLEGGHDLITDDGVFLVRQA